MDLYLETTARLADGVPAIVDAVALDGSGRRATHVVVRLGRAQHRFVAPIAVLCAGEGAPGLSWRSRRLRREVCRVAAGAVQLDRDCVVTSADDLVVGHLEALGLDDTGALTHLVVDSGYLWTQRGLRIPADAFASVEGDRIRLREARSSLSRYLPPLRAGRPRDAGVPQRPRGEPRPAAARAGH